MNLSTLWRGLPGHPIHPPLTDATIGAYTFATIAALADVTGISTDAATQGWWLALIVGLILTVPTALTGFADWLTLTWGTPLFRTATTHLIAMVSATVFFLIAALVGHGDFSSGGEDRRRLVRPHRDRLRSAHGLAAGSVGRSSSSTACGC